MKNKRRIGFDGLFADAARGAGTWAYAVNLIEELANLDRQTEFCVFLAAGAAGRFPLRLANLRVVPCRLAGSVAARLAYQNLILPLHARALKVDLIHSLGNYGPAEPLARSLVTVHDLLPFFDGEIVPGAYFRMRARALDILMRRSLQRADGIIAVSEFTRTLLLERYPFVRGKVRVIYNGTPGLRGSSRTDAAEFRERYGIRGPYILAVGIYPPHKNVERLISAFALLKESAQIPHQLVLAGAPGPDAAALVRRAACGSTQSVVFAGFVPDQDLSALYSSAELFVYPSLMEGFGLPLLEAMKHRVPVACSNSGPLPEVAGNAALFFDPREVAEIARAMRRLMDDRDFRSQLIERGVRRAERFSFRASAEQMLDTYERILTPRRETGCERGSRKREHAWNRSNL